MDFRLGRHRWLSFLIRAELSVLYLSTEDGFEVSLQDPLDVLNPVMGPMGFVIHDIYQINCHTQKEKNMTSGYDKIQTSSLYFFNKSSQLYDEIIVMIPALPGFLHIECHSKSLLFPFHILIMLWHPFPVYV